MVAIDIKPHTTGPKRAPQIVLLLDDQTNVLNVNRSLAGTSFDTITTNQGKRLHAQLHPDCSGNCRFYQMWNKAWASLRIRDSVEWEVNDPMLKRLLRLNLSRSPAPKSIGEDRRRPYKLLTITDITKYRKEYESLVESQQALVKLLMSQGADLAGNDDSVFDETGDTGNRLMAGYIRQDRSFGRQLVLAQEAERRRIASELHDGIAQTISVIKFKIEGCIAKLAREHPDIDLSSVDSAVDDIRDLVEEVRRISGNLVPSMLEDFGVQVALEWLCNEFTTHQRETQAHCTTRIDESETPDIIKIAVYRVVQEALNNASKHASATRVDVAVTATPEGGITLRITDDGTGFDEDDLQRGPSDPSKQGLRSMRERVEATGGAFNLVSIPGEGLKIRADWTKQDLDLIR